MMVGIAVFLPWALLEAHEDGQKKKAWRNSVDDRLSKLEACAHEERLALEALEQIVSLPEHREAMVLLGRRRLVLLNTCHVAKGREPFYDPDKPWPKPKPKDEVVPDVGSTSDVGDGGDGL